MVRRTILMGLLLIPSLAAAEELDLELGASMEYDSNVFRTQRNEQDDGVFRMIPAATLYRDEGDLRYRLRYAIPFEQGIQFGDQISDFDHILNLSSFWTYDEATEFFFTDTFRDDRSVTRRFTADQDVPDVSNRRRRVMSNTASLGLNHAFTARTTGGVSVSHRFWNSDQPERQDNQTFSATTDLNYALSRKNRIGTGFTFTLQDFESAGGLPESQTFYYNVFGSWVYQIDEVTSFSISAGPTIIQNDQQAPPATPTVLETPFATSGGDDFLFLFDTCRDPGGLAPGTRVLQGCDLIDVNDVPGFVLDPTITVDPRFVPGTEPGGASDTRITAFGNASLTRRWTPMVSSTLSYRRQQSNASGLGGSTILDAVTLRGDWQIDQWWDLQMRFDFTHRESVSQQTQTLLVVQEDPGGNNVAQVVDGIGGLTSQLVRNSVDTNRWGVGTRLARRIGRRAEASMRLNYNVQSSAGNSRGAASDFDVFLAIFGVRYRFEPITLW